MRLIPALVVLVTLVNGVTAEEQGNPSNGWDFSDATILAETRTWAALYWDYYDTGVASQTFQQFSFSTPLPNDLNPFDYAYDTFEILYADTLASLSTEDEPYSIHQLVVDDPQVMTQFRQYTTTGILATTASLQMEPTLRHLEMIGTALAGDQATVESFWLEGDSTVCSQALAMTPGPGTNPPLQPPFDDPDVPGDLIDFDPDLRDGVDDSNLDNHFVPRLYRPDHQPMDGDIGFDCDDFARAMAAWLRNRLLADYPDVLIQLVLYWWTDADGNRHGHAMVTVRIDGFYYIVDPQTGRVKGPFPRGTSPLIPVREIICESYGECSTTDDKFRQIAPYLNWPGEPDPWYLDPDVREHFRDLLNLPPEDVEDYIWTSGV